MTTKTFKLELEFGFTAFLTEEGVYLQKDEELVGFYTTLVEAERHAKYFGLKSL